MKELQHSTCCCSCSIQEERLNELRWFSLEREDRENVKVVKLANNITLKL